MLVSPHAGRVRVLNKIGTAIWGLLDGRRSVGDIRRHLIEGFDVPAEQVDIDLAEFLSDLSQRGLLDE